MSVQVRTDFEDTGLKISGKLYSKYPETIQQDAGRLTALAQYTIMGKKRFSLATTGIANAGNTGNGTVTAVAKLGDGKNLIPGNYNLECTAIGVNGRAAGAVTPGTNTGDGTVTALAIVTGEFPEVGNWTLLCTDPNANGAKSAAGVKTGTGNGAMGAITPGTEAIEGAYIATCIDASVSGSEIFRVIDPNGVRLQDMTVGVAYSNSHLAFTLADGGTDFIVGDYWTITVTIAHGSKFKLTDPNGVDVKDDILLPGTPGGTVNVSVGGISFTITDGGVDFALNDSFTLAVAAAQGGVFKLVDPNANNVATGLTLSGVPLGATTFNVGGMTFTITDGSIDFIVGDKFNITVTAVNKHVPLAPAGLDGSGEFSGIYNGTDIPAATIVAGDTTGEIIIGGGDGANLDSSKLVIETGTLDTVLPSGKTLRNEMEDKGLFVTVTTAGYAAENV
jgi:hypothetical protein